MQQVTTSMDAAQIEQKRAEIIEKYGKWTAHRIRLYDDTYTLRKDEIHDVTMIQRAVQIVADNAPAPMERLRILDLGSLEGGYAIEMALRGAEVVGIEGRTINIEKARFVQETLGLKNVEFVQDDVRNLSVEKYGQFDVVLCYGILYHLDVPDIFHFVQKISEVCKYFTVIDTLTSLFDKESVTYEGHTYWGQRWAEFNDEMSDEEKAQAAWSSLDNMTSFCLTHPSLYNLFKNAGFTSVYACHIPMDFLKNIDRLTLLARKGKPETLKTQPDATERFDRDCPEKDERPIGAYFNKEETPAPRQWRNPLRRLRSLRRLLSRGR